MLYQWINTLLVAACICSLVLYICPSGKIKELLEVGCTCVMLLALFSPLTEVRIADYASSLSRYREQILQQEQISEAAAEALGRQVIEQEYASYIINEASAYCITLRSVTVTASNADGVWVPYEVNYGADSEVPEDFKEHIKTQLGIPKERQHTNETTGSSDSMVQ